ncbi:hypothetical protein [Vibrio cincinnatiensis]|uniref:hypothetical protein n=1 Tax=Vibrio cincinnatiensis TaxID=675 RepID=UPI001EDFC859|nr:hypothetical protein [Vibrio cincinnatiensis]MCG3728989.1 hypothetical protein [Vibrio cincinnatiensis]
MAWYDGILETGGEIIGGAVDAVGGWTSAAIDDVFTYQKESAKSADPNAARKDQTDYQNNDGRAVVVAGPLGLSTQTWVLIGGGIVLAGGLYLAMKGK